MNNAEIKPIRKITPNLLLEVAKEIDKRGLASGVYYNNVEDCCCTIGYIVKRMYNLQSSRDREGLFLTIDGFDETDWIWTYQRDTEVPIIMAFVEYINKLGQVPHKDYLYYSCSTIIEVWSDERDAKTVASTIREFVTQYEPKSSNKNRITSRNKSTVD